MPAKAPTKHQKWGVLLLFVATLSGVRAAAQGIDPRLTFLGGASLLSGSRSFVVGPRLFDTQFQNGIKIGVRGTVNLTDHWGAEGTYSFSANGLQVTQVGAAVQNYGIHLHQFTANALYFFNGRDKWLRPFVLAGLGVSRYSPTSDAKMAASDCLSLRPRATMVGAPRLARNCSSVKPKLLCPRSAPIVAVE